MLDVALLAEETVMVALESRHSHSVESAPSDCRRAENLFSLTTYEDCNRISGFSLATVAFFYSAILVQKFAGLISLFLLYGAGEESYSFGTCPPLIDLQTFCVDPFSFVRRFLGPI